MSEPNGSPDDDSLLTAFLDGELAEGERAAVQRRLDAESALRARLALLAAGARPFREAFDTLLAQAPRARLAARLPRLEEARPPARRRGRIAAVIAAVLVAGIVGFTVGRQPLPWRGAEGRLAQGADNWRQAVADYFRLQTPETVASLPDNDATLAVELRDAAAGLELPLVPAQVALAGATLKRAALLSFKEQPLAELLYLDAGAGPLALCIIRNGQPDAPIRTEQRTGFTIAFWQHGGRGFLVIGRASAEALRTRAETVAVRFAS
jgi:anti-sigma factor RsiW